MVVLIDALVLVLLVATFVWRFNGGDGVSRREH